MNKKNNIIFTICVCLLATSCGGGGGGGGGGSGSTTGVRILHGAIEAAPLDLVTDNSGVAQTVRYGEAGDYQSLGEGQHLLGIYRTKDLTSPLYNNSITNPGNNKYTLLFYGDRGDIGLRTTLIEEAAPVVPDGVGLVRVIDGAVGALSVQLSIASTSKTAGFGKASEYLDVAPGNQSYSIKRSADGLVLSQGELFVEQGSAYSIFIAGEAGYLINTVITEE